MRIAIIDEDTASRETIKGKVKNTDWNVDFFANASDFGRATLSQYDVILADYGLSTVNGRELIKSIAPKTTAQMFLMGNHSENFSEEDINNERIKGLIDKSNPDSIISELKYISSKIKIKSIMEHEQNKLGTIFPMNGYSLENKGNILIIRINELLSESSRSRLLKEIDSKGIKKIVVSFTIDGVVSSPYLGFLVYMHKQIDKRGGKMVFWDTSGDNTLTDQLHLCNLSKIFTVEHTLDQALQALD
jgi:anti-anti-sigma regulatory factor/CheY-like chemotaxis protein